MIQRCHNDKQRLFRYYGGRGIRVAAIWHGPGGFERFLAHIGDRPGPGFSVERKDNSMGYEPGNVEWATRTTQMRNTRRAILVTIDGAEKPLKAWCKELGVSYKLAHARIRKGMDPVSAVLSPVRGAA